MTEHERTGWRDEAISRRHREWGFHCPGVDLDWPYLEYDRSTPVALIDYKHCRAQVPDPQAPSYRAMTALANGSNVPFLAVFYWPESWAVRVLPINGRAIELFERSNNQAVCPFRHMDLTEREYVSMLYYLREAASQIERRPEPEMLARLGNEKPPQVKVPGQDDVPF